MPTRKPKPGDRFRFVGATPLGIDNGALLPGTIVTIRNLGTDDKPVGVLPAEEPGAHDDTEDAVVIEWEAPGTVVVEMREEPFQRAELVIDLDGNGNKVIAVDDEGRPRTELVDRKRAIPVLGYGTVPRAMSIGLSGRDFVNAAGQDDHFPAFDELFELTQEA